MKTNQPPTIKDVADRAGVSISLVSLVINNRPKVSPHREALVRQAMKELGYAPPPPGRRRGPRLNSRRPTHRVAMVVTVRNTLRLQAPVYANVLHAIADASAGFGKAMTIHHLEASELSPEVAHALKQSDGAIFFGQPVRGPLFRQLQKTPCVRVFGLPDSDGFWDQVTYDNAVIGRLAAHYILEKGCRLAAFLGPTKRTSAGDLITEERGSVFREVMESHGCKVLCTGDMNFMAEAGNRHAINVQKFEAAVDLLLSGPDRPGAIFVPGDLMANTLHNVLLSRRLRPGKDMLIVSVNNEQLLLDHLSPRPATIDIHAADIGRAAVDVLQRRMTNLRMPRSVLVLQPTMVPGGEQDA
jgi:DNA-binding LacI/PurR family transcriptional regulator